MWNFTRESAAAAYTAHADTRVAATGTLCCCDIKCTVYGLCGLIAASTRHVCTLHRKKRAYE